MAGFKKKLPMSAALRPGGFGTVKPRTNEKAGGSFDLGKPPSAGRMSGGPAKGGISMHEAQKAPKAPSLPNIKAGPKMPSMPKIKLK